MRASRSSITRAPRLTGVGRVPLARALSKLGMASRGDAVALIVAGRVRVNGKTVTDPRLPVVPERIRVEIDHTPRERATPLTLAFHKPRGVVTTRKDPEGRPTVFDAIGPRAAGLITVGRLDMASTGLLLVTSDTRMAHWLTDPGNRVPRRYVVTVRGRVEPGTAARLAAGLTAPGAGGRGERLQAERVEVRKASARETHLIVELVEGKNREIRRLFDACGHEVTRVHRISYGPIELGTLQPGEYREVDVREWRVLQQFFAVLA